MCHSRVSRCYRRMSLRFIVLCCANEYSAGLLDALTVAAEHQGFAPTATSEETPWCRKRRSDTERFGGTRPNWRADRTVDFRI